MLSGLPRSGSQVLSSMLNQHPEIYSSTTSPVADLMGIIGQQWPTISQALVDPNPNQYNNIMLGVIYGAYKHVDKFIIVDKNRLWPRYGSITREIFGFKPRVICTVRSIPDILASYCLLIERNSDRVTFIDQDLIDAGLPVNTKNRCKILWEKYIIHPYNSLRVGVNSGDVDMLFLEYNDIVDNGQATIDKICKFISIDSFILNDNNLQPMEENDQFHGGLVGLHDVRPALKKISLPPEEIIGKELTNLYRNMHLEFWRKR
jgi:sulfotransferase